MPNPATNKRPRGRPATQHIERIDASPEEIARALFADVAPPDPSKRLKRKARKNGAS